MSYPAQGQPKVKRIDLSVLSAIAALVALCVIMLGAYVRLSDAGLGCPDWPGCYGRLTVPSDAESIAAANAGHPQRPVESAKAWKEMVHRYLASALGLIIIVIAAVAWNRRKEQGAPVALAWFLVALVVFQGLLGMWTVTLLVNPAIVTSHLAGGLATLALLWWLTIRQGRLFDAQPSAALLRLRPWARGGLALICAQILLGGWTSTNYAAVACTEFPTCYGGLWWPETNFRQGFTLWRPLGIDYEFGVLDSAARTAVHLTHRIGALVVLIYAGALAVQVIQKADNGSHRGIGIILWAALLLQIGLGIGNVVGHLPLPVAVAHNGGAALLMLTMLTLVHILSPHDGLTPILSSETSGAVHEQ